MWWPQSWLKVQQEFSGLGKADDVTLVMPRPVKSAYACAKHKETTWHV
jgi:hypothetical protein